jgi:hypothetical protein
VVRNPKGGGAIDGSLKFAHVVLPAADLAKIAAQAKDTKTAAED